MVDQALRFRKGYVDAPTGQVHYRSNGEGEPLLLLHQPPGSSLRFLRANPAFAAAGVRAIGMDTSGYGMSDLPEQVREIEDYAAVVPYLPDELGIEPCAVLGHHTGPCTAAKLADRPADDVTRIILALPGLLSQAERARRMAGIHVPPASAMTAAAGSSCGRIDFGRRPVGRTWLRCTGHSSRSSGPYSRLMWSQPSGRSTCPA